MNLKKYLKICLFITVVIGIMFVIFAIGHPEYCFPDLIIKNYSIDITSIVHIGYFSIIFICILLLVCL